MSRDGILPDGVSHADVDAAAPPDVEFGGCEEDEEPEWLSQAEEDAKMADQPVKKRTPSAVVARREELVGYLELTVENVAGKTGLPLELVGVAVWDAAIAAVTAVDALAVVKNAVLARLEE